LKTVHFLLCFLCRALRALIALCVPFALLLSSFNLSAQTDSYPRKPIRLVLPFPSGGGVDLVARPLAEKLSEALGQNVVVENMGGGSGIVAMQHVANSAPDGHTLILALSTQVAVNPALFSKVPYDSIKDFAPVTLIGFTPYLLVASPKFQVDSLKNVISLSKEKPGSINYASSGNGSGAHLAMEMIKSDAQIDLVHVPYKATPSGVRDVMAGEVQLMFVTIGTVRNQVKAGLLKPLAVTSLKRSGVMPQVPTVAESGLPNYESVVWYSVLAPAGTPLAIVSKLNQEINKVLKSQDYQQRLAQEAVEVSGSSPEQLQTFMKSEMIKWAKVVKDSGAKVD